MENNYVIFYVPVGNKNNAEQIAHALVSEMLAVCVNIFPSVQSIYRWQGVVEETQELVMIIKTRKDLASTVTEKIRQLHEYEVPCMIQLDVAQINQDYATLFSTLCNT